MVAGEGQTNPVVRKPRKSHVPGHIGMFLAALLLAPTGAGLAPWATPPGACCGGFLVAVGVLALDIGLVTRAWYLRRLLLTRCLVLLLASLGALGAALLVGAPDAPAAFQEVFFMPPPAGVRDLTGQRQYAGVFDADDILLRFVADEPTLKAILASGGFVPDRAEARDYAGDPAAWEKFRDDALLKPQGKYGEWATEAMNRPVLYRSPGTPQAPPAGTEKFYDRARLLWEPGTGRVLVHRVGGSF